MRILHLPSSVGGNAMGLSHAEKMLGHESFVLTTDSTVYQYKSDFQLRTQKNSLISHFLERVHWFYRLRKSFDVYHFNFGSSLLNAPDYFLTLEDVPFYKKSAKKIFTFQGCDARQKYPTIERNAELQDRYSACSNDQCYKGMCNSGKKDAQRRKVIEKASRYADRIFVLNPDLLYFFNSDNVSFLPYTIENFYSIPEKNELFFKNDLIHIVHAPTEATTKGSIYVLKAIEELQESYPNKIKFTLVENCAHTQALEIYKEADLFIDQLLVGWYGAVSVEVMKMGIPVIAYINPDHLALVENSFTSDLPIMNANPRTIKSVIQKCILEREKLPILGSRCKTFVEKHHDPVSIAKNIMCDLVAEKELV